MLFITVASLAANLWQFVNAHDLKATNTHLTELVADKTAERAAAEKLGCSQRAEAYFTSLGYSESEAAGNQVYQLQNHANARWHRCIMRVTITSIMPGGQLTNEMLLDVDDRSDLGSFTLLSGSAAERVSGCTLSPPDGPERKCDSALEWRRFANAALSD